MKIEIFQRWRTVSAELATMELIFVHSLMLLQISKTCASIIARQICAWKAVVSKRSEFSNPVELRSMHLHVCFRVAHIETVSFLALQFPMIVRGHHVIKEAVRSDSCTESAHSSFASAVNFAILLDFPMKSIPMLVEEIQMSFREAKGYCQLFEGVGNFHDNFFKTFYL
jgi:hypothetical protein